VLKTLSGGRRHGDAIARASKTPPRPRRHTHRRGAPRLSIRPARWSRS